LNWLVDRRAAAGAEFLVERIRRTPALPTGPQLITDEIDTRSLPLTFTYHTPSRLFVRSRLTLVRQRIHARNQLGDEESTTEHFNVFDVALGARLPRRRGIVSIELNNLFEERFRFRDTTFEGSTRVPQYAPERAVFARLQLNL
jgi:hypothetical protein